MSDVTAGVSSDGLARSAGAEPTLPEIVMLLLFNPRNGAISGEGLTLMYTLGGAMLTELAIGGHIELDVGKRGAHAVGDGPADPLMRGAWKRVPSSARKIRSLVVDIGPRSRESTLNALVKRGEIRRVPHRFLGLIPTHALKGGITDTRERLLGPVRAALVDGVEPDGRTAALIALLSASGNLAAMHADIPWSGEVYTRGKKFERGEWGARAASEIIVATLVTQVVGNAFATTLATLARPD
ncbi:GOLPH3/VPS74 family protein [Pengzhenrongella sicca]|uniref:GPP34 family phosphoprotein n=1 Tax=Pengzhenrongella sicca TaxID=2819238 RepID=A0A8A4ZI58_9MICO|nr:GPP34 family phosphoprotein [Pengzhenrongella sicca]QTE31071.1 GPP34 family phosphoprotein [Pengzhenrongella sicca]